MTYAADFEFTTEVVQDELVARGFRVEVFPTGRPVAFDDLFAGCAGVAKLPDGTIAFGISALGVAQGWHYGEQAWGPMLIELDRAGYTRKRGAALNAQTTRSGPPDRREVLQELAALEAVLEERQGPSAGLIPDKQMLADAYRAGAMVVIGLLRELAKHARGEANKVTGNNGAAHQLTNQYVHDAQLLTDAASMAEKGLDQAIAHVLSEDP